DLTLATDAPPGSGLGSSSALVVAMLAAVGAATGRRWSPAELARTAYQVERVDLKIDGGMQDQYAAAYGGGNFLEFDGDDRGGGRPPAGDGGVLEARERSLLLAWSGDSRTDDGILRRQVDGVLLGSEQSLASLGALKALAEAMRDALLAADPASFAWGRSRRCRGPCAPPCGPAPWPASPRACARAGSTSASWPPGSPPRAWRSCTRSAGPPARAGARCWGPAAGGSSL